MEGGVNMRMLKDIVLELQEIAYDRKLQVDDNIILNVAKDIFNKELDVFQNSPFRAMNPPEAEQPHLTPAERFILKDGGTLELLIGDIVIDNHGYLGFFNGTYKSNIFITCAYDMIGKRQKMHIDVPEGYSIPKKDINEIKLVYSPTREGVTLK